jgi:flavin reductase
MGDTGGDTGRDVTGLLLDPTFRDAIDGREFRDAMASLAASACVVTAREGAERLGRTVTAVLSLSADPPAILISIDADSALAAAIRACGGFSLAILADNQRDIADAFAGGEHAERRFGFGTWRDWPSGHPQLAGAVATLDCAVIGEIATASHVLFAGGPQGIEIDGTKGPLIWHDRRYKTGVSL